MFACQRTLSLTEWEELFANNLHNKGLRSRICKGLLQLNKTKSLKRTIQFENGPKTSSYYTEGQ